MRTGPGTAAEWPNCGRRRMHLMFPSSEVATGPTVVGFKGQQASASPAAYVGVPVYLHPCEEKEKGMDELVVERNRDPFSLGRRRRNRLEEVEKDGEVVEEQLESSSFGRQSSLSLSSSTVEDGGHGEEEEEEEEVQSKFRKNSLGSMSSLEESLPIKRGLSNFFTGKSKSFAALSDAATVKDLAKPENPFNKRRRVLISCKSSCPRIASYTSLRTALPPLLAPDSPDSEDGEEEEEEEEEEEVKRAQDSQVAPLPPHARKLKTTFRSPRSFSLSDLKHA